MTIILFIVSYFVGAGITAAVIDQLDDIGDGLCITAVLLWPAYWCAALPFMATKALIAKPKSKPELPEAWVVK